MEALLDFALTHEPYRSAVDPAHIAVMGHSLGGYTALAMGGAWPGWRDARITAVLALSPYAAPFVKAGTLGQMGVPVMFHTGTSVFPRAHTERATSSKPLPPRHCSGSP